MPTDELQKLKAILMEFLSVHKSIHLDALILTELAKKHILDWDTILEQARLLPQGPAAFERERYSRVETAVLQAEDCEGLLRALRDSLPKEDPIV